MPNDAHWPVRTLWLLTAVFGVAGALLLLYRPGEPAPAETATGGAVATVNPAPERQVDVTPTSRPARSRSAEPVPSAPGPTPLATIPEESDQEPWDATVEGYAAAFGTTTASHEDWVDGLRPWVTAHLVEQYALTDPAGRPDGFVAGIETITSGDYSAHVRITYDSGLTVNVRVVNSPDGWQVSYVEPASR